jgi:repressor LexA
VATDGSRRSEKLHRGRRPIERITDPQRRTLAIIRVFIDQRGFPPTLKELGATLGIAPASVDDQIKQLVRKGYLLREPGKARSLRILKDPGDGASVKGEPTRTRKAARSRRKPGSSS